MKIDNITINKSDILDGKDYIQDCRPCGFNKNPIFNIDLLPVSGIEETMNQSAKDFESFNEKIIEKNSCGFPDELQKGINKYMNLIENYRNNKNPELSIDKAVAREFKKKNKKKKNMCKITQIKKTVHFK